mgnify:CR=1 FL=1
MDQDFVNLATKNITDILNICIKYKPAHKALVVYDKNYGLTDILVAGYRNALPDAEFVDFDTKTREEIISLFDTLSPDDLVVLIQSTNFLLNDFRIRLHLFNKGLKVVEHMHLARNDKSVWDVYVNSLEYDTNWYPVVAPKLQLILNNTNSLRIVSQDSEIVFEGGLEGAKLNIGDYTGMTNVGGTFPIGEVFTENQDFAKVNGKFYVYAYADKDFNVQMPEPFQLEVANGLVVGHSSNTPSEFIDIINLVKSFERPLIREIGFGLNRAITKNRYLSDITAFERILGLHFSLGEKHSVYKKEGMTTNKTKFHIDIFPVVDAVYSDDLLIFKDGKYTV